MRNRHNDPPIKMWGQALKWGMSPSTLLRAIEGWESAHSWRPPISEWQRVRDAYAERV